MPHVLVVEDDKELMFVLEQLLENLGHQVTGALDGETAWAWLSNGQNRPDIILCDLTLPAMTGLTFLNHVRSSSVTQGCRFIAMSGSPEERAASFAIGACAYLVKPFFLRDLERVLADCLPPQV
ncbi:MAG: response regulator [bacterium]|nr:response regulator [bacterium]